MCVNWQWLLCHVLLRLDEMRIWIVHHGFTRVLVKGRQTCVNRECNEQHDILQRGGEDSGERTRLGMIITIMHTSEEGGTQQM